MKLRHRGRLKPANSPADSSADSSAAGPNGYLGTVVITRFSVKWEGRLPDVNWIDARFDLLQRIAFPSLSRQQVDGLVWVVHTAGELKSYVESLFTQISLPRGDIVVTTPRGEAAAVSDFFPGIDRFLTARLDSDDAFTPSALPTAIERCMALGNHEPVLFNFGSGYQLDWRTGRIYPLTYPASRQGPFLAVTNVGRDAMLDAGGPHWKARSGRQVIDLHGPQWIQVVHGDNVVNQIKNNRAPLPDAEAQAVLTASGVRR
jgi:hypothetical protein